MFFFIRERETLLGDVSTDVVKSESRVDSRNLHCRTKHFSIKDSTSETARERKDRAQREREITCDEIFELYYENAGSHGWTLESHTYVVGGVLGRRRIRLTSSAWKLLSLASKLLSRIHDSAP